MRLLKRGDLFMKPTFPCPIIHKFLCCRAGLVPEPSRQVPQAREPAPQVQQSGHRCPPLQPPLQPGRPRAAEHAEPGQQPAGQPAGLHQQQGAGQAADLARTIWRLLSQVKPKYL